MCSIRRAGERIAKSKTRIKRSRWNVSEQKVKSLIKSANVFKMQKSGYIGTVRLPMNVISHGSYLLYPFIKDVAFLCVLLYNSGG